MTEQSLAEFKLTSQNHYAQSLVKVEIIPIEIVQEYVAMQFNRLAINVLRTNSIP